MIVDALPGAEVISVTPPVALRVPDEFMTTVPGEAPGAKVPKSRGVVDDTDSVLTRTAEELTVPAAVNWAWARGRASRQEPDRARSHRGAGPVERRQEVELRMRFLSQTAVPMDRGARDRAPVLDRKPIAARWRRRCSHTSLAKVNWKVNLLSL